MSVIDEVLEANEIYARTHELRRLTPRPARKLAILTCMDTRLSIRTLGLTTGDAHIIRNAGGIVTEDSLRSLLISHYLLDTEEFMIINYTDCGLMQTSEQDLRTRIQNRTGTAAITPASRTRRCIGISWMRCGSCCLECWWCSRRCRTGKVGQSIAEDRRSYGRTSGGRRSSIASICSWAGASRR